ncbi:MAG: hypothetical protein ACXVCY_01495 [Pseudobdellovibrionaceae bacterium]
MKKIIYILATFITIFSMTTQAKNFLSDISAELNGKFNFPNEEQRLPEIVCVGGKTKGNNKIEYYFYRRNVYDHQWGEETSNLAGYYLYIYKPSVSAVPFKTDFYLEIQNENYFRSKIYPEYGQTECGFINFYVRPNGDHLNGFIDIIGLKSGSDPDGNCSTPTNKSPNLSIVQKYQPYLTSEPEALKCFKNNY